MLLMNFCRQTLGLVSLVILGVMAGCSSTVLTPPPVEDRSPASQAGAAKNAPTPSSTAASSSASSGVSAGSPAKSMPISSTPGGAIKPLPGAENAGLPGYYTIKPGDTLIRIGLDQGQSWRDIARWNAIENPNLIEVGQVLRVVPPVTAVNSAPSAPPQPAASAPKVESRAAEAKTPTAAPTGGTAATSSVVTSAGGGGDDDVAWMWPATGGVLSGFDEVRNIKGLAIGGKAGDPVVAAADGRVVYAGAGLRGYGNLVILKHNATYLTAYAHNQTLLVKEDQAVRRGQKIAEMGSSDADRVQLHFEIRRMGKPIDPAKLLPAR